MNVSRSVFQKIFVYILAAALVVTMAASFLPTVQADEFRSSTDVKLVVNGTPVSSGMGTCGLVGQIGVYTGWVSDIAAGTKAAITAMDWTGLVLICFVLPAVLCPLINFGLKKIGWVKEGDMKLD